MASAMLNIDRFIADGNIPKGFWVAGDDDYNFDNSLLTPFHRACSSKYTDCFNFCQSSQQFHVEQTFGQWTNKFRTLTRAMSFELGRIDKIVVATAFLHNSYVDYDREALDVKDEENEIICYDGPDKWSRWVRTGDLRQYEWHQE